MGSVKLKAQVLSIGPYIMENTQETQPWLQIISRSFNHTRIELGTLALKVISANLSHEPKHGWLGKLPFYAYFGTIE